MVEFVKNFIDLLFGDMISNFDVRMLVMWAIGGILIFLAIKKEMEPTLLLPMGFGAILVNLPISGAITQYRLGEEVISQAKYFQLLEQGVDSTLVYLLVGSYKAAFAGDGINIAFCFQFAICALHGVGVDGQLSGKLPYAGHFIVGAEHTCKIQTAQSEFYLFINGSRITVVNRYHSYPPVLTVLTVLSCLVQLQLIIVQTICQ